MNERIKQLRSSLELTQEDFGEPIGLKRATIAAYESGTRTPLDTVVKSICKEYCVREEWLRNGNGEMYEDVSEETGIATWVSKVLADRDETIQKKALNWFSKLDDDGWNAIAVVVEKLGNMQNDEET